MAFQLKATGSVSDGIKRNVRSQLEAAHKYLGALGPPHQRGASVNEAVHEVRKCFKRVRAALRLVREDLGDDLYRAENRCLRDGARPLTEVRDAEALIETADALAQQPTEASQPGAYATIHEALLAHQEEVTSRVLDQDQALATVAEATTGVLARLGDWPIEHDGWIALEGGLRRVYRTGRRALASASAFSTVTNLHEWRKQAKYLWHQLQLLEGMWTATEKDLVTQAHKVSTLLGEDHDLAVLRATLATDPLAYGGHRILKGVLVVIDRRRGELEQEAFALGRQLYGDSPRIFTSRIDASMKGQEAK